MFFNTYCVNKTHNENHIPKTLYLVIPIFAPIIFSLKQNNYVFLFSDEHKNRI